MTILQEVRNYIDYGQLIEIEKSTSCTQNIEKKFKKLETFRSWSVQFLQVMLSRIYK